MTDSQEKLKEYKLLRIDKERAFLAQHEDVRNFIKNEHEIKQTKETIEDVQKAEKELENILDSLLADKDLFSQSETDVLALSKEFRNLEFYPQYMLESLSKDEANFHRLEDKSAFDLIRNVGIFFGIVGTFVTCARNGVGSEYITINQAAILGGITGVMTLSHKQIRAQLVTASSVVMKKAEGVKNDLPTVRQKIN